MLHFECDYACGAAPAILKALIDTNDDQCSGYGEDEHCFHAAAMLKERCQCPGAEVHFVGGGTQANAIVIAAALRPFEGVLCAHTGHINVHETGAVEACGHKVLPLPGHDGKITASQIREAVQAQRNDSAFEHIVRPGMVYLSHPTELGTLYTRQELAEISAVCHEEGIMLYVDGARLVYGLDAMPEVDLPFLARVCDAFTLGGTKAGLLYGEAIVLTNPTLQDYFRYHIKQRGGMLAKGRVVGVQYEALLSGTVMADMAHSANVLARKLQKALTDLGCQFVCETDCNQLFPLLPDCVLERIRDKYCYSDNGKAGEGLRAVRFCTNVNTKEWEVEELITDLKKAYSDCER